MTELQNKVFDIAVNVINAINCLNLRYYLVCGSVLGAVKYNGFIPWDDDFDIALPRNDYEIFIQHAHLYLPDDLVIQNYHTEKNQNLIFTKIRNISTTYIEKKVNYRDIKHGVFVDVFPLDGYPSNSVDVEKFEKINRRFRLNVACTVDFERDYRMRLFVAFERALGIDKRIAMYIRKFEKVLLQNELEKSKIWCNFGNSSSKKEYAPREQYGDGTWATFEGLKVRIPERYDEYLTQKYGDWRADLPEDQKVGHHYAEVIDLTRPYTDYIVKLKNGKIRLKTSEELLSSGITPPEGYKY